MIGSRIGTPTNRGLLDARYVNVTGDTMTGNLTMAAESFIGPSSTTGIYFKSGNVGIGTTGPGGKLEVNGNILAPLGAVTAGNVSYSFTGDTDTGIYSPAANNI